MYKDNRDGLLELCKEFKKNFPNKTIWLYTGYEFNEISDLEILNYVDVVVDGKYIKELRDTTLKFRGSSNQNIIYLERKV